MGLGADLLAAFHEAMAVVEEIRSSEGPWPDHEAVKRLMEAVSQCSGAGNRCRKAAEQMRSGEPSVDRAQFLAISRELFRLSDILSKWSSTKVEWSLAVKFEPSGQERAFWIQNLTEIWLRRAELQSEFRRDPERQRR